MNKTATLFSLSLLLLFIALGPMAFSYTDGGTASIKVLCADTSSSELYIEELCADSFTLNGLTYFQDGIYKQTYTNAAGCDSTVHLILTLKAEKPAIAVNKLQLATTRSYETYRWYKNDTAIAGATNPIHILVPPLPGYYYVVVNEVFCRDTSYYYIISEDDENDEDNDSGDDGNDVKVVEQSLQNQVKLYPNPTSGTLTLSAPIPVITQISSLDGRILQMNQDTEKISLENLSQGIYFIRITDTKGNFIKVERVVKK